MFIYIYLNVDGCSIPQQRFKLQNLLNYVVISENVVLKSGYSS